MSHIAPVPGLNLGRKGVVSVESMHAQLRALSTRVVALTKELDDFKKRPEFLGDIDMHGNRVCNVGRTQEKNDVPPRSELVDQALYTGSGDIHRTEKPIVAGAGIRSQYTAKDPNEFVTLRQVEQIAGGASAGGFVTLDTDQIVTGDKSLRHLYLASTTFLGLSGNQHNLSISTTVFTITTAGAVSITGIDYGGGVGNTEGRLLIIVNLGPHNVTLVHSSASSSIANRIDTLVGGPVVTVGVGAFILLYTNLRWRVLSVRT